jgi:hypothetical protein
MQGKHDPLPSAGFLNPGRHFKHVVASSVPPRYSPSSQSSHPLVIEFRILPAAHSLHFAAPLELVRPFAHAPHVVFHALSFENVFKAHGLQVILPSSFWYSPGMHGRQYGVPDSYW